MCEIDYIIDECKRQHVSNYGDFAMALRFSHEAEVLTTSDFKKFVQKIASLVDPANRSNGSSNLRTSHVGFIQGGSASPAAEVHFRFDRWAENVFTFLSQNDDITSDEVDQCIIQLLQIHPWVDGNGRTASILRNWMLKTIDPLPYYF